MVVLLVLIIPAIICAILGLAGVRPAVNWSALCGLLLGLALLLSLLIPALVHPT